MDLREAALASGDSRHPWETARLAVLCDLMERHLPGFGKAGDTLLDIGCGDAWLLEQLAKTWPDARCVGLDSALTPALAAAINARLPNMRVYADAAGLPADARYRAVLLLDVIEHVADDVGMLKNLAGGTAARDALFFITVPAFQGLFSSHDRFLGHHRRYDLASFRKVLAAAGLAPSEDGYFFFSLLPVRVAQKIVETVLTPRQVSGVASGGKRGMLGDLADGALRLDYAIGRILAAAGIRLPGLSCYAICRRSR